MIPVDKAVQKYPSREGNFNPTLFYEKIETISLAASVLFVEMYNAIYLP